MVVSTHLVLLTVHTSLVTCSTSHLGKGMDWPGLFEESRNEIISFGFILQGSWGHLFSYLRRHRAQTSWR
ncbi:hypothetical protein M752DRAFT_163657 [Aspergillus phoenicis ATCC 13157]|uniref:Secreted protein n=1 Tax=Aspergillus phoenicis ATCC 13157 TaxID=1353007 RepID=A0A370PL48_ASPPH|nr:hypothetical protein M752DRAFT_163657 [Aspergillus phoenicis ATCC 13157]